MNNPRTAPTHPESFSARFGSYQIPPHIESRVVLKDAKITIFHLLPSWPPEARSYEKLCSK